MDNEWDFVDKDLTQALNGNNDYGCLLVDLRSGMMDGMYTKFEDAKRLKTYLEEQYKGSFWDIFKPILGRKEFKGVFPPDHLFHADVAERFGCKGEEEV